LWLAASNNVSIFAAVYVGLAEVIGADLLTADGRLARAPGLKRRIEVLWCPPHGAHRSR